MPPRNGRGASLVTRVPARSPSVRLAEGRAHGVRYRSCRSPSPRTTARSPTPSATSSTKHDARAAARALLEAADEPNASFYADAAALGWLGLHVPEEHGGSGYGLEELVVVVEQLGRAVAPGAFVPTVVASAVLVAAAPDELASAAAARSRRRLDVRRGRPRRRRRAARRRRCTARPASCIGAGLADVLLVPVGDDVAVVDVAAGGVTVEHAARTSTRRGGPGG